MSRSINALYHPRVFTPDFLVTPASSSKLAIQIGWFFTTLEYADCSQIANTGASQNDWRDNFKQAEISAYWAHATGRAENGLGLLGLGAVTAAYLVGALVTR